MNSRGQGMGTTKYIIGLILMLAIPIGISFYMGINFMAFITSDPMFLALSLISGLVFGFMLRRGVSSMGGGTGSSAYFIFGIILSVAILLVYGYLHGDILLAIDAIMANLFVFFSWYVGGFIGGLIMGSPST